MAAQRWRSRGVEVVAPRSATPEQLARVHDAAYLRAIEAISRHDGSVGWNAFVANSSALIAPFLEPEAARAIYADPRAVIAWGPPNESKATAVPGHIPPFCLIPKATLRPIYGRLPAI